MMEGDDGWADDIGGSIRRMTTDKLTGELKEVDDDKRPETDFFEFEAEEVAQGQEFLSVKPWKAAAAIEPDNHPPVDKSQPD